MDNDVGTVGFHKDEVRELHREKEKMKESWRQQEV